MKIIKTLSARNLILAFAIFWTFLIAVLCLISFKKLPTINIGGADKYVHFTFHFIFVVLWFCYFDERQKFIRLFLKVFAASVTYGIAIEIMQELFTTTRHADIFDVAANTSGALCAFGFLYAVRRRHK